MDTAKSGSAEPDEISCGRINVEVPGQEEEDIVEEASKESSRRAILPLGRL